MVMQSKIYEITLKTIVLLLLLVGVETAIAQKVPGLQFSEILVMNDSNCVDDYGAHSSWIEIFNPSNNFINIGGYYLTDDLNNPTKYWIPDGDRSTMMEPKSYLVFWADGKPERGIFHLSFDLKNAKTIALFNHHGTKLVDQVVISPPQKPDVTFGKPNNASSEWVFLSRSTPGTNNDLSKKNIIDSNEEKTDYSGFKDLMKTVLVVIFVLAFIFVIFKIFGRFFVKKNIGKTSVTSEEKLKQPIEGEIPNEIISAISMALFMYQNELHDYENAVLTMQKVSRTYSPWSSKIYTLRKLPR